MIERFYINEIRTTFLPFKEIFGNGSSSESKTVPHIPNRPLEGVIRGVKTTSAYLAHSYPTKVPPEVIVPHIKHYTKPGEIVLDPFCGSGMTGVAARLTGRRALLNDLSIGAAHLAYNHCTPCDPEALLETFQRIADRCEGEFRWLYGSRCDQCKGPAKILYTIWSDVIRCVHCEKPNIFWQVALKPKNGDMRDEIRCSSCGKKSERRQLHRHGSPVPVLTNYECVGRCGQRAERPTIDRDLALIREIEGVAIPYYYPDIPLDRNSEMYIRCALHLQGFKKLDDFYTRRNLRALARIWSEILVVGDMRVRACLAFAFTNTAWHATKMRRFNARGGQRPLTGTLYVPQLSVEANPLPILGHKVKTLAKFYRELNESSTMPASEAFVRVGCATNLADIPSNSVDYVFTDPPFGSNIFYSDLNLVWESWLGQVTDPATEAVINRSKKNGKTIKEYSDLLKAAFSEIVRVLKPGRWASVIFHNSDDEIWRCVQVAAEEAGLRLVHAGGIDKSKRSMRAYIGEKNEEHIADGDVALQLQKPLPATMVNIGRRIAQNVDVILRDIISQHLMSLPPVNAKNASEPRLDPRSIQYVHGLALRTLLNRRYVLERVSFRDIKDLCYRDFRVRGGRVFLAYRQSHTVLNPLDETKISL